MIENGIKYQSINQSISFAFCSPFVTFILSMFVEACCTPIISSTQPDRYAMNVIVSIGLSHDIILVLNFIKLCIV